MSHNFDYNRWKEHEGHAIVVASTEDLDKNDVVLIHCNYCRKVVDVLEFIPEHEESYEKT
jgi:hypothetical protein